MAANPLKELIMATYYLTIDGLNGGSQSLTHPGAFEISTYSFDVSNLVGAAAGTGKATFSPLVVDFNASGVTALLRDVADGQHIESIELDGVSASGHTVYSLKLGDVQVADLKDRG